MALFGRKTIWKKKRRGQRRRGRNLKIRIDLERRGVYYARSAIFFFVCVPANKCTTKNQRSNFIFTPFAAKWPAVRQLRVEQERKIGMEEI
jgi:hypothetical protein